MDHSTMPEMERPTTTPSTSYPPRKRSATMFNDPLQPENSFLPLLSSTHSGSQTPQQSDSSTLLSRKNSSRLSRTRAIPFLTLTADISPSEECSSAPPSAIRPVSPSSVYDSLAPIRSPVHTPPPKPLPNGGGGGLRTRSDTGISFKSVDFVLAVEEKLRVDTSVVDYDADPTFHRTMYSPAGTGPVEEAYVEKVGSFDIAVLRKDSLGNLPKINHSPCPDDSDDEEDDDKTVTASPYRLASPWTEAGCSPASDVDVFPDPAGRQEPHSSPDRTDGTVDTIPPGTPVEELDTDEVAELVPSGLIPFPPPNITRRMTEDLPSSTLALLQRRVTLPNPIDSSRSGVLPAAAVPSNATGTISETTPEGTGARKGSLSASIKSVQEILSRDATPKGTPSNSRRGSAW